MFDTRRTASVWTRQIRPGSCQSQVNFYQSPVTWGRLPLLLNQSQVSPFKSHNPSFHIVIRPDWIQSVLGVTFRNRGLYLTLHLNNPQKVVCLCYHVVYACTIKLPRITSATFLSLSTVVLPDINMSPQLQKSWYYSHANSHSRRF